MCTVGGVVEVRVVGWAKLCAVVGKSIFYGGQGCVLWWARVCAVGGKSCGGQECVLRWAAHGGVIQPTSTSEMATSRPALKSQMITSALVTP